MGACKCLRRGVACNPRCTKLDFSSLSSFLSPSHHSFFLLPPSPSCSSTHTVTTLFNLSRPVDTPPIPLLPPLNLTMASPPSLITRPASSSSSTGTETATKPGSATLQVRLAVLLPLCYSEPSPSHQLLTSLLPSQTLKQTRQSTRQLYRTHSTTCGLSSSARVPVALPSTSTPPPSPTPSIGSFVSFADLGIEGPKGYLGDSDEQAELETDECSEVRFPSLPLSRRNRS